MHLWRFINSIPQSQKNAIISMSRISKNPSILLIMSYFDNEEGFENISPLENEIRRLLKYAEKEKDYHLLIFSHEAMGRIFFIKGLFVPALAHFRRAVYYLKKLKKMKSIGKEDYEMILSKLLAWVGLSALHKGEYKLSARAFDKAIRILEKNMKKNEPIIGELKSLRGDALSFIDPEESVNEVETAHEILIRYPSAMLLTNAVKIFGALVIRNYKRDAIDLLSEAYNFLIYPDVMIDYSLSFYKNYQKLLGNIYYKVLKWIDLSLEEVSDVIKKFIYGTEGVKGIYPIFRYFMKPVVHQKNILAINKTLTAVRYLNISYNRLLDELLAKKEFVMEKFERAYYLKFREVNKTNRLLKLYEFDNIIDAGIDYLQKKFNRISIISIEKTEKINEYILTFYDYYHRIGKFRKIEMSPDWIEEIFSTSEDQCDISEKIIDKLKLEDLMRYLSTYNENDLLIFSPISYLHKIPIERLMDDTGTPIGIKTNIIRVPTIYFIPVWFVQDNQRKTKRKRKVIIDSHIYEKGNDLRELFDQLRKEANLKIQSHCNLLRTESIDIYHHVGSEIVHKRMDSLYDDFGTYIFNPSDIEKLNLDCKVAILDSGIALEEQETPYYKTNFAIAFMLAGVMSVVATSKRTNVIESKYFFRNFYREMLLNKQTVSKAVLSARRELYYNDFNDWFSFLVYGNPLTMV